MEIYTWPCAPPPPPPHHATPHTIIYHAFHKLSFFFTKNLRLRAGGQFRLQITVEWVNKKNAPKPICTLTKSEIFVPRNTPPHHTAVVKEGGEGTGEGEVRRGRWVCGGGDGGDEGEGRDGGRMGRGRTERIGSDETLQS